MRVIAIKIDGAVVFPEMKKIGDTYVVPDMNHEYKLAILHDGYLWASKDKKDFVIAISVKIGEENFTINSLKKMLEEQEVTE